MRTTTHSSGRQSAGASDEQQPRAPPASRDLPGFYFDAERNRYFPLSSRSGQGRRESESVQDSTSHTKGGCRASPNVNFNVLQILHKRELGANSSLRNACASNTFKQEYLETQASKPWVWSYREISGSADGAVEEFYANIQTNEGLQGANVITWGDSNGIFGVCEIMQSSAAEDGNDLLKPQQIFPPLGEVRLADTRSPPHLVPSRLGLISSSKVTAIRRLRNALDVDHGSMICTTLGSAWEGGAIYLLKQKQVYDECWRNGQHLPLNIVRCAVMDCSVWTAAYCAPTKATLGTSKGAVLVHLETSALTWLVHSKSDVLSQQCDLTGNLIFCGFRNGYISMVDIRSPLSRPRRMPFMQTRQEASSSTWRERNASRKEMVRKGLGVRQMEMQPKTTAAEVAQNFCESMRMKSAVCSLVLLQSDETYLLASAMNGDINLWDRRLVEKGPVLTYEGNHNTHSMLSLGVDASESLLASGGEDRTIRIWGLRSGRLLQTISGLPGVVHGFSSPTEFGNSRVNGWKSCLAEPLIKESHAWRMWLGLSSGLMYMHGAATNMV